MPKSVFCVKFFGAAAYLIDFNVYISEVAIEFMLSWFVEARVVIYHGSDTLGTQ